MPCGRRVGWPLAGFGAEIAYQVQRDCLDYLDAPVKRVTGPHAPVPYNKALETAFMPQPDDVVGTVRTMLARV